MDALLHALGVILLLAVCAAAMILLLFGLPGTWVIVVATALYAWATDFATVGWPTLGWLSGLAVVGEVAELVAGTVGVGGARPSRRVMVAALAGGFIGAIAAAPFLFGVGALLGALAGAFLGAAIAVASEGGTFAAAIHTGLAALRGRLLGFLLKGAIAATMVVVLCITVLR